AEILDSQFDGLSEPHGSSEDRLTELMPHMQHCLAVYKEFTASAIAARWRIRRSLATHRALAERWARCAHAALTARDAALADRALARQNHYQGLVRELEMEDAAARRTVEHRRTALESLERRLARMEIQYHAVLEGVAIQADMLYVGALLDEFREFEESFQMLIDECSRMLA